MAKKAVESPRSLLNQHYVVGEKDKLDAKNLERLFHQMPSDSFTRHLQGQSITQITEMLNDIELDDIQAKFKTDVSLKRLMGLSPDLDRYMRLRILAEPKSWVGMKDKDYIETARFVDSLNDNEIFYLTKNMSYFDYAQVCNLNPSFQAKSMIITSARDEAWGRDLKNHINFNKGYAELLQTKKASSNPLTNLAKFLILNPYSFNQSLAFIYEDQVGITNVGGECFGLTGAWLTTDKFHKNLREVVNQEGDYTDKPMIRQILALQRNQVLQSAAANHERGPKQRFDEASGKKISDGVIDSICKNPDKNRMQFYYTKDNHGHTMGMRIKHKGDMIHLKYFDPNFGERRFSFKPDDKGKEQASRFIKANLTCSKAHDLSYEIQTRAEFTKRYTPETVHQIGKEAVTQLQEKVVQEQPPVQAQKTDSKDKLKTVKPVVDKPKQVLIEPMEISSDKAPLIDKSAANWSDLNNIIKKRHSFSDDESEDSAISNLKNSPQLKSLVEHAERLFNDDRNHALPVDKRAAIQNLIEKLCQSKDEREFKRVLDDFKNKKQDTYTHDTTSSNNSKISSYDLLNKGQGLFTRIFQIRTTTIQLIDKLSKEVENPSVDNAENLRETSSNTDKRV